MTRNEAIARLRCIASADISTRKPTPYLKEIAEACHTLGLGDAGRGAKSKNDLIDGLERIGAEKMRETANALLGKPPARPKPTVQPAPPSRPERLQRVAQQASVGVTAAECNELLRSLPPIDPENPQW